MFGLFGKKKKPEAVPEEESIREEKIQDEAESREFRELAAEFDTETLDLLALTGPNGFGSKKEDRDSTLWTLGVAVTAWLEEDGDEIHEGDYQLVTRGDDVLKSYLRGHVPGDFILKFKGRLEKDGGNRILMVNLPEPGYDPSLKEIQTKQKEPVSFEAEGVGTFSLARSIGWLETDVEWLGDFVQLTIDKDEDWDAAAETARGLLADAERFDSQAKDLIARELLPVFSVTLEDPDTGEGGITEEEFRDRLVPESFQVCAEGRFSLWYNDGDMFSGYSFHAEGTLEDGIQSAKMEN